MTLEEQNTLPQHCIFLIPNSIGNHNYNLTIPLEVQEITKKLRVFFVENLRSARRYLRKIDNGFPINECTFYDISKRTSKKEIKIYFEKLEADAGIISEAGMPAIADPGAGVVGIARQKNFRIVPLVGASSIFLALSASGLNGQNFAFNGYLPIEKDTLKNKIRDLEKQSRRFNQTQIFIETPYRNNEMLTILRQTCKHDTLLCVAKELTTNEEEIITLPISKWKNQKIELHKQNVIFLFQSFS